MNPTRAWGWLVALSLGSTVLAASGASGAALILPVLALAGVKGHVILKDYLCLARAPGWLRGMDFGLALLMLAFAGLALAA